VAGGAEEGGGLSYGSGEVLVRHGIGSSLKISRRVSSYLLW
jgi:hypothetical protein